MASRSVAVRGEVDATEGEQMFTGADSGTWTVGQITYESHDGLTVGGQPVIHGASCTFSFSGLSSSNATITGSETVTLSAGTTVMQNGQTGVLLDGDSATGEFGNRLIVMTANVLKSA